MFQILLALLSLPLFAGNAFNCQTTYDELNIPRVETASTEEFYYCFGLHHGQDRAWAMDYFRRVAQGRNAEVLGFDHIKSDLMMRLLDLPSVTEKIWESFPEEKKRLLNFYADGVNKGFETGKNSSEFKAENYEPEKWEAKHSILVLLLQSFDQTRKTFSRDYEEELSKRRFGDKAVQLFNEDGVPWENTIMKEGEYPKKENAIKTTYVEPREFKLWSEFPTVFGYESGSNNWVVSSAFSKSGKAMLANDPHLDLKTPMFWYWIQLKSPTVKVIGGSVPGVPVIASGTNGNVAWGLTNSYLNSADAVFVKDLIDSDVESFRPLVKIRFWWFKLPFFFKSFEKLKTGHRVLPLEIESDHKLVLRWTGFNLSSDEIYPMFDLYSVKNVTEMDALIARIGVPSWNFVFADSKGDIGYRLVGKVYKHEEKLPMGIPTQTLAEFTTESYLDPSEKPHVLKPKRNYVYSANNRHWPSDAKFYGGRGYSQSFRGQRIDQMIVSEQKHDFATFRNIQCDRKVVDAQYFLPRLKNFIQMPELDGWNELASDDSKALPVYRRFMDLAMERWNVNEYAFYAMLEKLNEQQVKELKAAYEDAKKDVDNRNWGEIHKVGFFHLSRNANWVFSPEIAGIGDTHTVDPGTAKWNSDRDLYEQNSGASMRMIVELGDGPQIQLALPGVNRGYDQKQAELPWRRWKNCEYSAVKF